MPAPRAGVPSVGDLVAALDARYDPRTAEPWDAVGLACGDPDATVETVLFAVDATPAVADEAVSRGAQLLVTHHPLFLRGVHTVAATTPKGRVLHRLVTSGVALYTAHTNADRASPGVSDALAETLGLTDVRPLVAEPAPAIDKVVVFVPEPDTQRLVDALAEAGAGSIGVYTRAAWYATGTGTFRPEPGATPAIGEVGRIETVSESRVEMVLPRRRRTEVVAALRAAHPYEEPAFDVLELASLPGPTGHGRVGAVGPVPLRDFAARVAEVLPATPVGVRVSGDLGATVTRVAVMGGAGDGVLDQVRAAGVDAYVTADLRHHPAIEAREHGGPALVDAGHWATEWPWLAQAARLLEQDAAAGGATVRTAVSTRVTDPWSAVLRSPAWDRSLP